MASRKAALYALNFLVIAVCIGVGAMSYLELMIEPPLPKEAPNLTGNWCAGQLRAKITQTRGRLTIRNEMMMETPGYFKDATTAIATEWGKLPGVISDDGNTLTWGGHTVWRRKDKC